MAKFLELPLKEFKKVIDELERAELFRRLRDEGCISFKEFPGSGTFEKYAYLPPNCLAVIKKSSGKRIILYTHPRINGTYIIRRGAFSKFDENILRQIRKISTRNQLTQAILTVIINYQKEYLESGNPHDIKPLTGQMIKEMSQPDHPLVNNSVISRVIRNKKIMLPWGETVPLKDLMPNKKDIYKRYVRKMILQSLTYPLNDDEIRIRLKRIHGISISRKSVCQARKEMGIVSWSKRSETAYYLLAVKTFSIFYPLERRPINLHAPESPGVYELCINRSEIVYPKGKSGKFYIGSAKNIRKRLKTHRTPNHKNSAWTWGT